MVRAAGANRSAAEHSNGISPGETRAAVANKLFLVSPTIRAATESATFAFALSALATFVLYTYVFSVHAGDAVARSGALGLISCATVFLAVSVTVRGRLSRKKPVLGAKRGAVIAIMTVVVVAFVALVDSKGRTKQCSGLAIKSGGVGRPRSRAIDRHRSESTISFSNNQSVWPLAGRGKLPCIIDVVTAPSAFVSWLFLASAFACVPDCLSGCRR